MIWGVSLFLEPPISTPFFRSAVSPAPRLQTRNCFAESRDVRTMIRNDPLAGMPNTKKGAWKDRQGTLLYPVGPMYGIFTYIYQI